MMRLYKKNLVFPGYFFFLFVILATATISKKLSDFVVWQLMEWYIEFNQKLNLLFVDFRRKFDPIRREGLWHNLLHHGIPYEIAQIIKSLYD